MQYKRLTEEGKKFIKKVCEGTGNSNIRGKSRFKAEGNPNGVLPYTSPPTSPAKIWISNAKYNGTPITTNQQLGEALIDWYDKYGKIYQLDSNILAAQAYQESNYKLWNYALTSTASGISQFTIEAVIDIIFKNWGNATNFTQSEIEAIQLNIEGSKTDENTFLISRELGKKNRPILHQNIIDNPEIMIKAQFRFMKVIANKYNTLASNVLFGYNRGFTYIRPTYAETILYTMSKKSNGYEKEGIDYVFKIFGMLGDKNNQIASNEKTKDYKPKGFYFGYDQLNMNKPPKEQAKIFDAFQADVDGTNELD